jgi:hypothetical protein
MPTRERGTRTATSQVLASDQRGSAPEQRGTTVGGPGSGGDARPATEPPRTAPSGGTTASGPSVRVLPSQIGCEVWPD